MRFLYLPHVFAVAIAVALAGCGGGASVGSPTLPSQTSAPGPRASASAPASVPAPTPTATTTSGTTSSSMAPPVTPAYAAGHANAVPTLPASGASRAGTVYNIYITASTGDTVAFTVFEPATLVGGQTYPLILQAHGWGGSRVTSTSTAEALGDMGNIPQFIANGYGVISMDQRGWGESTGKIRAMDPDFEGKDELAVMDWAQNKLGWLAFGPTIEGDDAHEPIMGSAGGSYGGMYQLMLSNIDVRHRLHAIVPQFAPHSLNDSLFPGLGAKNLWAAVLFGTAEGNPSGPMTATRADEDPGVYQNQIDGFATGTETQADIDFNGYHSTSYWCNGTPIATNGAGLTPQIAPHAPPKINALFIQGMRDTLFDFNEAYENYRCYQNSGGDVRLMTYQFGHNSAGLVPDPGASAQPANNDMDMRCGTLSEDTASLAFFNEHLKMMAGAANVVPTTPCLSMKAGDGVVVPSIVTGHNGTEEAVPSTMVVAGAAQDQSTAVDLGITVGSAGNVIGGIPRLEIDMEPVGGVAATADPVVYVGVGQLRPTDGSWDLIDNILQPIRGVGKHAVDLPGIAQRLPAGTKLGLLIFGNHDQYDAPPVDASQAAAPYVLPVDISGNVWLPLLGPLPSNI